MGPTWDVAIVGGGVAGLSVARELSLRGARCVLLEAAHLGAGASGVPVALLNPHRGRTARASEQDAAGLAAAWEVATALGARGTDPGAHRSGVLRIASSVRQADAWRGRAGARWLGPSEVPPPYHAPHGALFVGDGGWLEPRSWLAALAADARARGAELREGVRVLSLTADVGRVVLDSDAGPVLARRVVLCVGAEPNPDLPLPPIERVAGEVVTVPLADPPPLPLAGAVYAAFAGGRAHVGGNHRPPERTDPEAPDRLLAALRWFLPGLPRDPAALWSGVRARARTVEGGRAPAPIVADVAPGVSVLGGLAGRGFLVASLLARRLAERLAP